ncbi:type I restriction endonuclease subunit R [Fibrobacter succinogenes]|uniref:type I restriction endonuclease subunit R n=1 Tax=Fibrobacter succinogenes TaxID=833 RepID=UPI001569D42C|nr:type I restriction endonuclease subunit R [Fibrobacter succinogenes]
MSYEYSENILVQESAGNLLQELGWRVVFAYNIEVLGDNGTFGRKSYRDVLLLRYFKVALQKLNPWINQNQIEEAVQKFTATLSTSSLLQINEEKYGFVRDGIPVTIKKPNGQVDEKRALIVDFNNPSNNDFLAVKEMKIHGELYHRRTDIVGFVNGIPLLFVELKRNDVAVQNAYDDNYTDYLSTIPQLFYYNAFLMLSNGFEAKVGTLGSKFEFFHEWKRLKEDDAGSVALATMLKGICRKETFIDLLENFILYDHSDGHTVKILARNHQYLGVNEAFEAYKNRKLRKGKLGVFWHTQGSGKSYSMLFLSQKIRRRTDGSPTIVVLTDRDELNKQISETFENCKMLGGVKASKFIATSGNDLIKKLKANPSFIFTLIQKFNKKDLEPIHPDHDILILSDEAHRSQNGIFADNMCNLLPDVSRLGFTGTPLLKDDNITERTFGGYISIYDFKRAVEDGATVPLYYENRADKIKELKNPEISDKILDAIEKADLDPDAQEKLERDFAKEYHLLTAEPRLRAVAKDFVKHYSDLWTSGKAMFVCLNKVTCVRMFNYAQEYWAEEIKNLETICKQATQQEAQELNRKIQWMRETEMAVVVSDEQNEQQTFAKWGLDIVPHRKKMEKRELDKEFKDSNSKFRIVFVCAMWLTGFDVKSLSCLYLDKLLKAHTLMQTIARANRVNEGKSNGLIVDYAGIVKALRKALADYTNKVSGSGNDPTIDKEELLKRIVEVVAKTESFLGGYNANLKSIIESKNFDKLAAIKDVENAVCSTLENKKTFSTYAAELVRLMKYTNRDDVTSEIRAKFKAIDAVARDLKTKRRHVTNVDLMVQLNQIMNEYVDVVKNDKKKSKQFDISKIDFDLLRREFAKAKRQNLLFRDLEELIKDRLAVMLAQNPFRINYYDRYREIIEAYNSEQDRATIEKTFMDLMNLAASMNEEEQRYVREGFKNDEELSLYDMLFKDDLSKQDIKKIKEVAVDLLQKVKAKIAEFDHWTDKQETKAAVDNLIRDTLWSELPESFDELSISEYRQRIYEYVYTHYKVA